MAKKPETKRLAIELIRRDGGTQARDGVDPETVEQYRECYTDLPKPKVCRDEEGLYWLWDGFHTLDAMVAEGRKLVECEIYEGEQEDARWRAAGANLDHDYTGKRRTNADKRRAVKVALSCPTSAERTNAEIATHCGVDSSTVAEHRPKAGALPAGGATRNPSHAPQSGAAVSAGAIHSALPSVRKKKKAAKKKGESPKPASGTSPLSQPTEPDLGQHDDPKWLHGTRAELKVKVVKEIDAILTAAGRAQKLLSRLSAYDGQAEAELKIIAAAQSKLAAIAGGLRIS